MSRAQVAVRVATRAIEIRNPHPSSRVSVYRVLQSEMDCSPSAEVLYCMSDRISHQAFASESPIVPLVLKF